MYHHPPLPCSHLNPSALEETVVVPGFKPDAPDDHANPGPTNAYAPGAAVAGPAMAVGGGGQAPTAAAAAAAQERAWRQATPLTIAVPRA
jgi:hypothetical protein